MSAVRSEDTIEDDGIWIRSSGTFHDVRNDWLWISISSDGTITGSGDGEDIVEH